jgi:hypothetical protein
MIHLLIGANGTGKKAYLDSLGAGTAVSEILRQASPEVLENIYKEMADFLPGFTRINPWEMFCPGVANYFTTIVKLSPANKDKVVCLHCPESEVHFDFYPHISEFVDKASQDGKDIYILTYSETLLSEFIFLLDELIVFEHNKPPTKITKQELEKVRHGLLTLGELWTRGFLGGVRW